MVVSNLIRSPKKAHAVDLYAFNPDMTAEQVARKVGVELNTVYSWRSDPNFIDAIYKRYMIEFGGEIPAVLSAMIREAKAGNVQAGRLVLEHSGKLVKNINVTIDSPFEKWLSKVDEAEIVDGDMEEGKIEGLVEEMPEIDVPLPPRAQENQRERVTKEKNKIRAVEKDARKKSAYLKKRKEWYRWKKRAEAVGVAPLPSKRPTKGQRDAWESEIVKREQENI